jgi:hypothetical protein
MNPAGIVTPGHDCIGEQPEKPVARLELSRFWPLKDPYLLPKPLALTKQGFYFVNTLTGIFSIGICTDFLSPTLCNRCTADDGFIFTF